MMVKEYDIAVFGATGLTGKHIVEHVFQQMAHLPSNFSWAVAGRNPEALTEIVETFAKQYPDAIRPAIIEANVVKRPTLDALAKATKVIINAVGPFRFLGEYVVRACVEQGCDYVDVTGEPEFVERMQRTYHDQAKKTKVTLVHCCGFDSIPADMGVLFVKRLFTDRGWTPSQIEMALRVHVGPAGMRAGYATYESAVHGFGSSHVLQEIRKVSGLPRLPRIGPKLAIHKYYHKDTLGYLVPFKFADPAVVRLSQQLMLSGASVVPAAIDKPMPPTVQFAAYLALPSFFVLILYYIYGFVFSFLATSPWGRNLLLNHPERFSYGVFSKEHPTPEQLAQTSFELTLRAKGYDSPVAQGGLNTALTAVVRGPEPGYVATPRIVFQSALTLLQGKQDGTVPTGGVLTPAAAFWDTDLIERLRSVDIHFDTE